MNNLKSPLQILNTVNNRSVRDLLNSIAERRLRLDDGYKIFLDMAEEEFMMIYDDKITNENAKDVLNQFLLYHQDDGRAKNVEIIHDKVNNMIKIEANLSYDNNDHTDEREVPRYILF